MARADGRRAQRQSHAKRAWVASTEVDGERQDPLGMNRRRSGALLLVAAAFFGVSTLAFLLDGDLMVGGVMGIVAIGLATAGAWRLMEA